MNIYSVPNTKKITVLGIPNAQFMIDINKSRPEPSINEAPTENSFDPHRKLPVPRKTNKIEAKYFSSSFRTKNTNMIAEELLPTLHKRPTIAIPNKYNPGAALHLHAINPDAVLKKIHNGQLNDHPLIETPSSYLMSPKVKPKILFDRRGSPVNRMVVGSPTAYDEVKMKKKIKRLREEKMRDFKEKYTMMSVK